MTAMLHHTATPPPFRVQQLFHLMPCLFAHSSSSSSSSSSFQSLAHADFGAFLALNSHCYSLVAHACAYTPPCSGAQLRRKHRDRVVRRGLALIIESDFYATDAGRQHFADQLTSIRYCVQETCNFDTLYAYLSSSNYDFNYDRAKNLRPKRNIKTAMNHGAPALRLVTPGLGEPGFVPGVSQPPRKQTSAAKVPSAGWVHCSPQCGS